MRGAYKMDEKRPYCKVGFLKQNCKYKWPCKECNEYENNKTEPTEVQKR